VDPERSVHTVPLSVSEVLESAIDPHL
jgi:hypothetical protein